MWGDALLRQVSEAVKIREESGQMNRQQEWRMVKLPRLACWSDVTGWGALLMTRLETAADRSAPRNRQPVLKRHWAVQQARQKLKV